MGKTARWFRALLGSKNKNPPPPNEKKKWGFIRSFKHPPQPQPQPPPPPPPTSYRQASSSSSSTIDPNKHAIAVAAATAAVAEAAVAAAQAAAAVVKLTSSGRCTTAYVSDTDMMRKDVRAAVLIQSSFRGYLARKALKALKGLVKLQALVRGHIRRKKTADEMRCMQAMVRLQSRARAGRTHNAKPSLSHQPGPATPEKHERTIRSNSTNSTRHERSSSLKRNCSKPTNRDIFDWDKTQFGRNCVDYQADHRTWDYYSETRMKYGTTDDDKGDKILEIDPGKPHFNSKHRHISHSSQHALVLERLRCMDSPSKDSTTAHLSSSSQSTDEVQSRNPQRQQLIVNGEAFCTAENSPQFYSAKSIPGSSKRSPFTPTKSDCSRSFQSVYSDHPNYMATTASAKAKVRSQSAPKQRLEFEKCSSAGRYTGLGEARPSAQRTSVIQSSFVAKAYPGSGRLDRLGMPIQYESVGLSGVYRNRY